MRESLTLSVMGFEIQQSEWGRALALFNAGWLKLDSGECTSHESNRIWYSFCRSVLFDLEEVVSNSRVAICTILSSDCKLMRLSDHANVACLV